MNRDLRNEWEQQCNRTYIQPILEVYSIFHASTLQHIHLQLLQQLEAKMGDTMEVIMNDNTQGNLTKEWDMHF